MSWLVRSLEQVSSHGIFDDPLEREYEGRTLSFDSRLTSVRNPPSQPVQGQRIWQDRLQFTLMNDHCHQRIGRSNLMQINSIQKGFCDSQQVKERVEMCHIFGDGILEDFLDVMNPHCQILHEIHIKFIIALNYRIEQPDIGRLTNLRNSHVDERSWSPTIPCQSEKHTRISTDATNVSISSARMRSMYFSNCFNLIRCALVNDTGSEANFNPKPRTNARIAKLKDAEFALHLAAQWRRIGNR
jgi:hypothetical protein